ncbi:hypothetical protein IKE88_03715 [Candidatus Saccharibacteria bacterium]|nr:hypothetical protein [Candidatus Saccharibacteria bacterium]
MKAKIAKWCDEWRMAALGIILSTRKPKFWVSFLIVFIVFGTLLNLLSDGFGSINLFFALDFGGKIDILWTNFLALFGVGRTFLDWLMPFALALLQGTLISLIIFIWKKRIKNNRTKSSDIQNAGIAATLALLGSGCPTCGTALITPIISSIFSSGSYAIAGTISGIITIIAIIILLLSIKKVGLEAYVIIKDEQWRKKRDDRPKE